MRYIAILFACLSIENYCYACSDSCGPYPYIETKRIDSHECGIDEPYIDPFNTSRNIIYQLFSEYYGDLIFDPTARINSPTYEEIQSKFESEKSNLIYELRISDLNNFDSLVATLNSYKEMGVDLSDRSDTRVSNTFLNTTSFIAALRDAKIDPDKFSKLAERRIQILGNIIEVCKNPTDTKDSEGLEYARYLNGIESLYCLKYKDASDQFCSLKNSNDSWMAEHAHYMCGRSQLVSSQEKWAGDTLDLKNLHKSLVEKSILAFEDYLKKYPEGRYKKSAQGLKRRAAYFLDDEVGYLTNFLIEFENSINQKDKESIHRLLDEFDNTLAHGLFHNKKNLPTNPLLAAAIILTSARYESRDEEVNLYKQWVSEHEKDVEKYPGLTKLLRAYTFFAAKNYKELNSIDSNGLNFRLKVPIELIKISALEKEEEWEDAIKGRKEMIEYVQSIYPDFKEEDKNLSIEQFRAALNTENQVQENFALKSSRFNYLKTLILAGKLDENFRDKSIDIPVWGRQLIIQKGLSENELRNLMSDIDAQEIFRVFAKETLLRMMINDKRYDDAKEVLSNDIKVSGLFKDFSPEILDELDSGKNGAQALIALANFIINASDTSSDYYAEGTFDMQFFSELLEQPSFRNKQIIVSKQQPLKLFMQATQSAKKEQNNELLASAMSHILDCFKISSRADACKGRQSAYEIEKLITKDIRKKMFDVLKNQLKDTEAGKKRTYWY